MTFATSLLLKHKDNIYQSVHQPKDWNRIAAEFVVVGVLGAGLFGLVMSTQHPDWKHAFELFWKAIVLIWAPIALCTPSLYVFSALRGVRVTLPQLVYLLVGALATTGIVLVSLAPISWFFTWTTDSVNFVAGMNGMMIGLSLLFGLFFLGKGFLTLHAKEKDSRSGADILAVWFILLLVVIAQMADKLSPWYAVNF